jgi:hypothetical protein
MVITTTMTILSSETAFTATHRRRLDRQKTQTPTLLLPRVCRCHATTAALLFVMDAIGAMNFKLIMKLGCVIDAMHFTAVDVTKWINVKIVVKLSATLAQP